MTIGHVYTTVPYPGPPLTLDNILEAIKRVKSWRELGWWLLGRQSRFTDRDQKELDAIQHQHVSDEACLKALVEVFLDGSYQPSWRRVIHALHQAGESHLAEMIKTNAEPVQGE